MSSGTVSAAGSSTSEGLVSTTAMAWQAVNKPAKVEIKPRHGVGRAADKSLSGGDIENGEKRKTIF